MLAIALAATLAAGCNGSSGGSLPHRSYGSVMNAGTSSPIQHVVIVMQENRSFDNMFHGFPGANTAKVGRGHGKQFQLQEIPLTWTFDLNHSHTQFLEDYDQGKDDGFDSQINQTMWKPNCHDPINHPACWLISKNPKLIQMAYSYVRQSDVAPYWTMAQQYALGDNAFPSNNGPTYVSHQYLIAGESGHASEVPAGQPWGCNAVKTGPYKVTVELLAYGQADPPVFSKATGHRDRRTVPMLHLYDDCRFARRRRRFLAVLRRALRRGIQPFRVHGHQEDLQRPGLEIRALTRYGHLQRHHQ